MKYPTTFLDLSFYCSLKVENDPEQFDDDDNPGDDNDIFDEDFKADEYDEIDEKIFATKYEAIESIFKFKNSSSKGNGLFHLQFSCVICERQRFEPEEKLLKTTTPSPMSNLRAHLKKLHPNFVPEFDNLVR